MNKLKEEEKVHRVLEIIASYPGLSQRDVASHSGLSLGLVNLIVKRLIRTGHIKMSGLNSRKVQYILTPKGLVAKAKRTYLYMMSTVRTFFEYQRRMEQLIS
jgi:DNA-binding MarR family transcriptional regulator